MIVRAHKILTEIIIDSFWNQHMETTENSKVAISLMKNYIMEYCFSKERFSGSATYMFFS